MTKKQKTKMIVHTDDYGEVEVKISKNKTYTRAEIVALVAKKVDDDPADIYVDWEETEVPSNVTYNLIANITQNEIDQLKSDVENEVDSGYDMVASGMGEAVSSFARQYGYSEDDIHSILHIDNFSVDGDEKQVRMTANSIRRWKPEHRKQLLALLAD